MSRMCGKCQVRRVYVVVSEAEKKHLKLITESNKEMNAHVCVAKGIWIAIMLTFTQ